MGEQEKARKMTQSKPKPVSDGLYEKRVREAAQRALEEAEQRRGTQEAEAPAAEINGPKGPEPTRFGDWEKKGIAYDF